MSSMVMVRAHTLDFVPLAGIAGWSVSAEKGGGHVWWRARLDERGNALHYRTAETGPVTRRAIAADTTAASCAFSQRAGMRAG